MKKSLLALAALSAFAGAASAENSVTLYGRVDLSMGQQPWGLKDQQFIAGDKRGIFNGSGNRVGLRGVEELGNGVQAIFNLEHRFRGDTGMQDNGSRFWHARSIVGLQGGFGRFTLGREYTSTWDIVQSIADPWGADTVASNLDLLTAEGRFGIRTDSSATYQFNAGGFKLGAQIGESQDVSPAYGSAVGLSNTAKKPWNVAAGFGLYGFNIGVGHERNGKDGASQAQWTSANVGYDFRVARANVFFGTGKNEADQKLQSWLVGAAAPLGAGELRASYGQFKNKDVDGYKWKQAGVGYHYSLSKRTTVYADYVRKTDVDVGKRDGYDVGLKHNF